jgi:elongation factor 1-beta
VKCFQAFKSKPDETFVAKFPNVLRWYKHIATFESDFSSLSGDPSKAYTAYGPESSEVTVNPAKAPADDEDEDIDLFASDDEEEDAEAARIREERLAEYHKKKAGKQKPAAKVKIITLMIVNTHADAGIIVCRHARCQALG